MNDSVKSTPPEQEARSAQGPSIVHVKEWVPGGFTTAFYSDNTVLLINPHSGTTMRISLADLLGIYQYNHNYMIEMQKQSVQDASSSNPKIPEGAQLSSTPEARQESASQASPTDDGAESNGAES